MNAKLLLYGAIGFFAIRYFMRQRQTAVAAPVVSLPLPDQSREQQIFDVIPVNTMPDGTGTVINRGPNGNNNNSGGGNGNNRAGQL